ncbi:hypothetical protein EYR38_002862 [Pleurotus pulmonarius]|nr:hypothetical protein EYR38_002862 [Pleurotus pulmonarius]
MSPKKAHEVDRMTAYVQTLVNSLRLPEGAKPCFVDVGAGQVIPVLYPLVIDFPLSQTLSNSTFTDLPPSAYHLATQIPSHWFDNDRSSASTVLSVRKVVWRALLGHALAGPGLALPAPEVDVQVQSGLGSKEKDTGPTDVLMDVENASILFNRTGAGTITQRRSAEDGEDESTGSNQVMRRLGRLADSAYRDWDTFLLKVGEKLGISVQSSLAAIPNGEVCDSRSLPTATQLETLHVLRCLLGPAVETLIARDRIQWVADELANVAKGGNDFDDNLTVRCINLFDQGSGSGRNTAIVIAPSTALESCNDGC